jgi:hypothetical protein
MPSTDQLSFDLTTRQLTATEKLAIFHDHRLIDACDWCLMYRLKPYAAHCAAHQEHVARLHAAALLMLGEDLDLDVIIGVITV